MITNTIQGRPLLQARLWAKAATQVFRQRITMLWLFYFTNGKHRQHNF
jgi:hypothetical protein